MAVGHLTVGTEGVSLSDTEADTAQTSLGFEGLVVLALPSAEARSPERSELQGRVLEKHTSGLPQLAKEIQLATLGSPFSYGPVWPEIPNKQKTSLNALGFCWLF